METGRRSDMKNRKAVYYILMFLPLVLVLIALPFLPEQIPAHYGADGTVTRWGSKFETLIFPVVTIIFGAVMLVVAQAAGKNEEDGKNNEKVTVIAGLASLAVFDVMTCFFLYTDFNQVEDLGDVPFGNSQILFTVFGAGMIVLGNVMPKLRMNSVAGLRTKWSMKNETVWKKCQRFGGISFIVGGICMIIACFLAEDDACLAVSLGILCVLIVVDVWYTYLAAKEDR